MKAGLVVKLAVALSLAASAMTGCSSQQNKEGKAQVAVMGGALCHDDNIQTVTVTVTGPEMLAPVVQTLTKDPVACQWTGLIDHIWAGPSRLFQASAKDGTGVEIYAGQATATVERLKTVSVFIILQQVIVIPPYENAAPVITGLSIGSLEIAPGDTDPVVVTATDPNPGDVLTYTWSLACPAGYSCLNPVGGYGDASASSTNYLAPIRENLTAEGYIDVIITVRDPKNAFVTFSVTVHVGTGFGEGSALINAWLNTQPAITDMQGAPSYIPGAGLSTDLTVVASDRDGDALTYSWSSPDCVGNFSNTASSQPTFTLDSGSTAISCTFTVLVSDTHLASNTGTLALPVGSHHFESNPCVGMANGTYCNDGNKCHSGATCQEGVCQGAIEVQCTKQDQCHEVGVCDAQTGLCPNPASPNNTPCNDGNACTEGEMCNGSGACLGGQPKVCTALDTCHEPGTCDSATGECSNPVSINGKECNDDNACTSFEACVGGVCGGGAPTICPAPGLCQLAGMCNIGTGLCEYAAAPDTTECNDNSLCTSGDHCSSGSCIGTQVTCTASDVCHVPGVCQAASGLCSDETELCVAPMTCDSSGPTPICVAPSATCTTPLYAKKVASPAAESVAVDATGNVYNGGSFFETVDFGTGALIHTGAGDAFVQKMSSNGTPVWSKSFGDYPVDSFGDPLDPDVQAATGVAVSNTGLVGVIGNFTSSLTDDAGNLISYAGSQKNFILGLNANGNMSWSKVVGLAGGDLYSIVGHPDRDSFLVCGFANAAAASGLGTGLGLVNHGGRDILVAKIDAASGTTVWAKQIGDAVVAIKDQICMAAAYDEAGDVLITGQYAGTPDFGNGIVLPDPTSTRKAIFVAKLSGANGTTLAARGFEVSAGSHLGRAVAVDLTGDVFIAGNLGSTGAVTFSPTITLATSGGTDVFLAKLSGTDLSAIWARGFGSPGNDSGRGVAVDSMGNPTLVGEVYGTATVGNDSGGQAVTITAASISSPDAFTAKFNGADGLPICAHAYGDGYAQTAGAVAVNRAGIGAEKDVLWVAGIVNNSIDFGGAAGTLTTPTPDTSATFLLKEQ